jgi:pyridoxine 5-phosphate synthase
MKLGVNIDHIATIRQIRGAQEPEPAFAAIIAETAGANSIVAHLREDRRHINDRDVTILREVVRSRFNLEMSIAKDIVNIACAIKPDQATLVPEKRREVTTEGGLDVAAGFNKIKDIVRKLVDAGIEVSLFIDPQKRQIDFSKKTGAKVIELHTGRYAGAKSKKQADKYFAELTAATSYASVLGLTVNAGHGLDYYNVSRVAGIKKIEELNIGYSIVCRAAIVGIAAAVKEMKALI